MFLSFTSMDPNLCETLGSFNIRRVEQLSGIVASPRRMYALAQATGFTRDELGEIFRSVIAENKDVATVPKAPKRKYFLGHRIG